MSRTATFIHRSRKAGAQRSPQLVFVVVALAMAVFVVGPIVALFLRTLYSGDAGFLGLDTYRDVFGHEQVRAALTNTLYLVVGSMVLSMVIGTALAWIVSSTNVPYAKYLRLVPLSTMLLPPMIGAIGWQFLLSPKPGLFNIALRAMLPGQQSTGPLDIYSIGGMIWVNSLYVTPYVYVIVANAFRQYDSSLDEAARVSGSRLSDILRFVTIPVVRPALMGGFILALATTLGDFSVPFILGTRDQIPVLTTQIYNELTNYPENVPGAAALSTIVLLVTLVGLYVQRRMLRGPGRFVTVGGRGVRHRVTELGGVKRWMAFGTLILYVAVAVIAPIAGIVSTSFRPYWDTNLGISNLTLKSYHEVINGPIALSSIRNSAVLGLVGASIGIVVALVIGYTVQRSRMRGRGALDYVATIPIAIPGTVFGAGLLLFFLDGPVVLYGTYALLLIGYVAHFLPQGFRPTSAALGQTSPELEEAAMICGSSWVGSMRRITLPLLAPALASGWILMFILISRELALSTLLATSDTPVIAFAFVNLMQEGFFPQLAAFSVFILVMSGILTIISQAIGNRRVL